MKLRKPSDAPPGGWVFAASDGQKIISSDFRALLKDTISYYSANGIYIPDDLDQIIEDQICERIPKSMCWKGFGDRIANAIQGVAGVVDSVAGTTLQAKAKGCSSCGQRKRTLNKLTQ